MNEHDPEERDPGGALAEGESLTRVSWPERGRCGGTRFRIAGGGGLESVPLLSISPCDSRAARACRRPQAEQEAEPQEEVAEALRLFGFGPKVVAALRREPGLCVATERLPRQRV
jgi:hypothetical protein